MIDENGYIRCDCVRGKILAQLKGNKLIFHCRGCKQDYVIPLQELLDKHLKDLISLSNLSDKT